MRILLVAISHPTEMTGVHRHAINLAQCLLQNRMDVDMVIGPWQESFTRESGLCDDPRFTLHLAGVARTLLGRNIWHCISLPRLINDYGCDIVHLTHPVPFIRSLIFRPVIVTLHDLYPLTIRENFGRLKSIFNRAILRHCLRAVDAITAVSDHTLAKLQELLPHQATKAVRIHNCIATDLGVIGRSPLPSWRGYPFLLCVAQHRRNKNLVLLLRAFHRLQMNASLPEGTCLVIVGIQGPETPAIAECVRMLGLEHRVKFLAGLTDPELRWCYRNAAMLVAPSLTEGFGYPVAEALRTGCKFVCSDIPPFREIGNGHGHFFSLYGDAETQLVEAIMAASAAPAPESMRLVRFSPTVIAALYCDLYSRVQLSRQHRQPHIVHGGPHEEQF